MESRSASRSREGQSGETRSFDPAAFEKLIRLLRYVDGDYEDPSTFTALRKELQDAQRPAHYLAIPPVLFEMLWSHPFNPTASRFATRKLKVLKAIPPIEEKDLVRGQFRGYRNENGVAKDSQTEPSRP
jgi:glucose-6-phosphate 1-dehydrogenase